MKLIINLTKILKELFLYFVIYRFLYTNGAYKIYGFLGKKYLYGIVVYTPYPSVYKRFSFQKSYKYHLDTDTQPQWYLVNGI
jgi:hypothetical protein